MAGAQLAFRADDGAAMPRADAVIAAIHDLRGVIEARAAASPDADRLDDELLGLIEKAGVFTLMAPAAVGGPEAHPAQVFEALKLLSYMDGSTGWYCQAGMTGVAVAGAFLGERGINAVFHSGRSITVAGQAAPTGRAEREGDGYRISGAFSFGSGTANAQWIVGGYVLHEGGRPVLRADGSPVMLIGVADRATVEFSGNWNVLGLRGTGSWDFTVAEQHVHADFVFDPAGGPARRGGAPYRMGFLAIPTLCHAAFGAGCGRRILDEWAAHALAKKRVTGKAMAEGETFRAAFAQAHGSLRSAEAYVRRTYDALFDAASVGTPSAELDLDSRLAASNMLSAGTRIAQAAFTASATTALRDGHLLQRAFRDMQAGNAHFLTGEQSFIDACRDLLALGAWLP